MRVYFSSIIDKSVPLDNSKLSKKISKDLKKILKTSKSDLSLYEHNTFLFLAAAKIGPVDLKTINDSQLKLSLRFQKYYNKNKIRLEKELKSKRELRETSQIVKSFLKQLDSKIEKSFETRLKKRISELPTEFFNIQNKSTTAIWKPNEEKNIQLYLPGCTNKVYKISQVPDDINLEMNVDKIAFLNFFSTFLEPTLLRLQEISRLLETLRLGLHGKHFKSENSGLQTKFELFLRILSAKLSSLQNLDKITSSIFELFTEPEKSLRENFEMSNELQSEIRRVSAQIDQGNELLADVQGKLEECLTTLKNYLDETKNKVKVIKSTNEFKITLLTTAELSSDLFIEAELLKLWLDFFSSDIPFFTFQSKLFNLQTPQTAETSDEYIISVRGLVKNYSLGHTTVYAVRGVDLDIKDGEFVAIVGNSGAGKTTLLNCIAGLDDPDYGVVFFKGKDLHHLGDSEKSRVRLLEMGFIFQNYALMPHFNARENIALPADLAGFSKDLKDRIEELLGGVGIDKQAKQYPAQLSGGQLQRVAIARALTNRPKVLFADEPTGDLDSKTGKQVMELIKKFHEETKTTVIIITHEQDIAGYAQKRVKLEDGVIKT